MPSSGFASFRYCFAEVGTNDINYVGIAVERFNLGS